MQNVPHHGEILSHQLENVRVKRDMHHRWWPLPKRSARQLLFSSVKALPYVALCTSVLALGLIAGFILASPLAPQVLSTLMLKIFI